MSKLVEDLRERSARAKSWGAVDVFLSRNEVSDLLAHIERLESNQIPEGFVAVSERELLRVYLTGYWEDEISKTAERLEAATHGEGE